MNAGRGRLTVSGREAADTNPDRAARFVCLEPKLRRHRSVFEGRALPLSPGRSALRRPPSEERRPMRRKGQLDETGAEGIQCLRDRSLAQASETR